jgi:hypothetical protein
VQARLPRLELVYLDGSGSRGAITLNLKPGTTVAAADVGANALASVVASLTDAELVRSRLQYRFVNEAYTIGAIGSAVKRCGVFIYECAGIDQQALIEVPSIRETLLLTSGPSAGVEIDREDAGVIAFNDLMVSVGACNPFVALIETLLIAYRQSRV